MNDKVAILLSNFRSGSANDEKYPMIWLKSASLVFPQMNQFLQFVNYKPNRYSIVVATNNDNRIILGNLFTSYGSDKTTTHNYEYVYSNILEELGVSRPLNILEVGLGTNNPNLVSSMGIEGKPGASIRAFRDFLPNSNIYGADVDRDILFTENRIQTFFVDQLEYDSFQGLVLPDNQKYDLIIDDGLHNVAANLNTLLFGLNNICVGGYVVVEDIAVQNIDCFNFVCYLLENTQKYKVSQIKRNISYMLVVKRLA